jgi:uncharacterized damage-inducible protein DinB
MSSELQNYLDRIEDLRGQVVDLVRDLPLEALNWRPTDQVDDHATNTVAVLATHVAGAEHFLIAEVVGGRPPTRDRDAEFKTRIDDPEELVDLLREVGQETRDVFSALTPANLGDVRIARDKEVPIRWLMLHVVDHTALHLGHMQLTYQLWMGGRAVTSPRWFQRLPNDS